MRWDYYENNTLVTSPTTNPAPNGATNVWANWSGVRTLQHGGQYGVCAQGQYTFPNDSLWISDGPNSCAMGTTLGRRAHTTIDRSKPTAAVTVAGGAATTKDSKLPIQVAFSDDVAGPFPADFMCFQFGRASNICDKNAGFIYGYNSACSVPGSGGKSTTFTCTADFGASPAPDGPVWACVIAARRGDPGQPGRPEPELLGRQGQPVRPPVRRRAARPHGAAGDRRGSRDRGGRRARDVRRPGVRRDVRPQRQLRVELRRRLGQGERRGALAHFMTAGTYEVRVTTTDAAGNAGEARKVINVAKPGDVSDGGGSTGGGSTGGGSTGGGSPAAATSRTRRPGRPSSR